jgi:hypothetical protein
MKRSYLAAVVAVLSGAIVLFSFIFPSLGIQSVRGFLLELVIWLAAIAFLIAIGKITLYHINQIQRKSRSSIYSATFVLMMIAAFSVTMFLDSPESEFILRYIQIPAETAFLAIISFTMIYSIFQWIRRKPSFYNLTFVVVVLITLVSNIGFLGFGFLQNNELFSPMLWASAGIRGILIGVALGTMIQGVRILLGLERPYGK